MPDTTEYLISRAKETIPRFSRNIVENPSASLSFEMEFAAYKARKIQLQQKDVVRNIEAMSQEIHLSEQCTIISAIPVHILEIPNEIGLGEHISSLSSAAGTTVFLINDATAKIAEDEFKCHAQRLRMALRKIAGSNPVSILSEYSPSAISIGAIRGILSDAIMHACQQHKINDPIMLSNDVDVVRCPANYAAMIRDIFLANPFLDILTGPVYYGYGVDGEKYLEANSIAPELMLQNRFRSTYLKSLRNGVALGWTYSNGEGANKAFRMAALCAVGGYRHDAFVDEDEYVTLGMYKMRAPHDSRPRLNAKYARYEAATWRATDPRRQLRAMINSISIQRSWDYESFAAVTGAEIDTMNLLHAYSALPERIQFEDLAGRSPDEIAQDPKIIRRVSRLFEEGYNSSWLAYDQAKVEWFLNDFGLCNARPVRSANGGVALHAVQLAPALVRSLVLLGAKTTT
jgi:hypothetical protein